MKHKINSMVDCYEGDALEMCKQLPSESVQCVVTSPPYYGLRDYGVDGQMGLEETPEQYIEKMVELFREIRRVLRDDGTVWLNIGDSYASGKFARHDGYKSGSSLKMTTSENGERQRFNGSAVSNLSYSVHAVLKGSTLFAGETYPRTAPAERVNVFVYDKRSPDRVLVPLLGVKRVLVKERDNNLCEIGGALNSPVRCYLSRSLLGRLPADANAEGDLNTVEELSVVVTAGDLDADSALSPVTVALSVKGGEAPFAIEVAGEPVAEGVVNVQPVGDTLSLNADAESGCKIDLVNEPVALADGLHPASRGLRDFRVRKASVEQLQLSLVCGRIDLDLLAVSHVFVLSSGGFRRYWELYHKANSLCNLNLPKQELGIPFRVRQALIEEGWLCRQTIIWHKPSPMPESVTDRCTKAHEYVFLLAKSEKYFFDAEAIKEPVSSQDFHLRDRNSTKTNNCPGRGKMNGLLSNNYSKKNKRSVWTITTKPFKEAHFATMPPDLAEICIKAGTSDKGCCPHCGKPWVRIISKNRVATRPGNDTKVTGDSMVDGNRDPQRHVTNTETIGWNQSCQCDEHEPVPCLVLDPFGGAGTTGLVASKLGRRCTMIELNPKYIEIMKNRLKEEDNLFSQ